MYKIILVPVDGSATARRAVSEAAGLAKLCGARVRLLHVIDMTAYVHGYELPEVYISQTRPLVLESCAALLADCKAELTAAGVVSDTEVWECLGSRVSDVIIERAAACAADLIILGTHGRRGVNRLLMGSDAEMVVRTSPVPVLLVRVAADAAESAKTPPKSTQIQ